MRNGTCFPRLAAERHICADGSSSSLPTPSAQAYGTSGNGDPGDGRGEYAHKGTPSLDTMARRGRWPTPTAGDSQGSGSRNPPGSKAHPGVSLTDAVRFGNSNTPRVPTPKARDYRPRPNSPDLEKVAGGLLNPTWVEWLMGFPREWTDVIVAICIWEWNVMGRCPNWTHDHHTEPGAGWLLAACFVATWAAVWLGGRR
jgi:hypothetical protein